MREALVIVAKQPEIGKVKTRLARTIGGALACELYIGFLIDLNEKFAERERPLFWAVTPPGSDLAALMPGAQCFPQEGESLGERVLGIFDRLFRKGFGRVVVMSSDFPHMPVEWIDEAFARLAQSDVVFVPADDGGYNAVGLREPHDLFTGVTMSTPHTLEATLECARRLELSIHLLPSSFDVDTSEDLDRLRGHLFENAELLPHTRKILSQLQREKQI